MVKFLYAYLYLILFTSSFLFSQSTPQVIVENMGRGINLGNVLSAPTEGNWAFPIHETFFDDLVNQGFTNVRLPIDFFEGSFLSANYSVTGSKRTLTNLINCENNSCFSRQAGSEGDYTGSINDYYVNEDYLDRIQQVIDWSISKGLVTVLDFHGAKLKEQFLYTFSESTVGGTNYYTHPTSAKRKADINKFKAIWKGISERFKDYSEYLLFEVFNEPYFYLSAEDINALNLDIISVIRSTGSNNLNRKIIITGGDATSWEVIFTIPDNVLNSDSNLIATFHYYQPFNFTASSQEQYNEYSFSENAKNQITTRFNQIKNWSQSKGVPVYLGEFGADNSNGMVYWTGGTNSTFGGPNESDRIEYHRFIANSAMQNNFSFSAWCSGNKSTKSIHLRTDHPNSQNIISGNWVEEVKDALLEIGCYSQEPLLIQNPDFDCGVDNKWNLSLYNGAIATYLEASDNVYEGNTAKINVSQLATNNSNFNKVILNNQNYSQDLIGKTVNIKFKAKSNSSSTTYNALPIKLRFKLGSSGNNYVVSDEYILSENFESYEFEFDINQYYDNYKFQIMVGKHIGDYFFDEFQTTITDTNLSLKSFENDLKFYPNPLKDVLIVNSNSEFGLEIYSITGTLILSKKSEKQRVENLSVLEPGIYLFKFKFIDEIISKIIFKE